MEGAEEEDAEVPVVVAVRWTIIAIIATTIIATTAIIVIVIIAIFAIIIINFVIVAKLTVIIIVITIVITIFCIRVAPAAPVPGHMQGPGIAVQVFTFLVSLFHIHFPLSLSTVHFHFPLLHIPLICNFFDTSTIFSSKT